MKGYLESVVNCPACGQEAIIVLESAEDIDATLAGTIEVNAKTSSFQGWVKCASCGVPIVTYLSISAIMENEQMA
jgi:predicted RNA-binding Zn-ribbon protein involved in translation (DUF1610 family)